MSQEDQPEKKDFDAGNRSDVRKRSRDIAAEQTPLTDALKTLMSTVNGRAWVWWLLGEAGLHRVSFAGDPYRTAFNEGQRNLGLIVFAEIHRHCVGDYAKMVSEAQPKDKS